MFYDLHIHSCLSPCGDVDMTPNNIVNMAVVNGLDVIALTDHNTVRNCPAAMEAGEKAGVLVIPGMELTTSEEIHIVCLFPALENAMAFSEYVYEQLYPINNVPKIFGEQIIMDSNDQPVGSVEKLLINATAISVMDTVPLVNTYGGFCYPAHVDKKSNSILTNIGGIPPECGFTAVEFSKFADEDEIARKHPIIDSMRRIRSSDAHYLEHIGEAVHSIDATGSTASAVIAALQKNGVLT